MITTDLDSCRVINENLNGRREVDEHTFAALAMLQEKLDRLKESNESLSGVTFSPYVDSLINKTKAMSII